MTVVDVLEAIANGENSYVEFKRDTVEARDLAKEMVALANLDGGRLLLGVEDDGSISGVTRTNLEEFVMNAARDLIRPPLVPGYERVRDVESGNDVAVVHVEGYAVHAVWRNNRSTYYIRVGSTAREASADELERLFQRRGSLRAELRPVSGTTVDSFDLRRLRDYFDLRGQDTPDADDKGAWEELLVNTEIMRETDADPVAAVAGIVLFGLEPEKYLPHSGIDAVAYPGTEPGYETVERGEIRGPLLHLGASGAETIEPGVVGRAMEFVRRNTSTTSEIVEGVRVDRPEYPDEPVREAVVNALVHRDWLLTATNVQLSVFEDRLEIVSPGRLPNGITPDRMRAGVRSARNQMMKDVMRDYGYLEHMGMGIRQIIIRGMAEHNGTEPDLIEDREAERFMIRLYA